MSQISAMNQAFIRIPVRAERQQADILRNTFVDIGIANALQSTDHQILYGRRGTGKTHAFKYLQNIVDRTGDIAIYVDLRTIGSPGSLFIGSVTESVKQATGLLVDLLRHFHDELLARAIDDELLTVNEMFVTKLDALFKSIGTFVVEGEVERKLEQQEKEGLKSEFGINVGLSPSGVPKVGGKATIGSSQEFGTGQSEIRRGIEERQLNFGGIAKALRELAGTLSSKRIWILLDEWSSIPPSIQPYLAEFLTRCILPLSTFIVKIAALEQQCRFRTKLRDGSYIGIEVGADVAAYLNLDEFMVFDQSRRTARAFFRGLFFKHLTVGAAEEGRTISGVTSEADLINIAFTQRGFDELVRAAEGVPRDAINIAASAALKARDERITVPHIQISSQTWFRGDKAAALSVDEEAHSLFDWIIHKVANRRIEQGFLIRRGSRNMELLTTLFDARVLHVVRRDYVLHDDPSERYDIYTLDHGAYFDLVSTKRELRRTAVMRNEAYQKLGRGAILDLDDFPRRVAASA